jgi:phosphate/sulfate permease
MNEIVISGLLSSVIAAVISALVASLVARFSWRTQEKQALHAQISKLLDYSIQYPYLEDDTFCASWVQCDRTSEASMRYENYCCAVFNLLERNWTFFGGHENKMSLFFDSKEMILRHRAWWMWDPENRRGYTTNFRKFVSKTMRSSQRRKHDNHTKSNYHRSGKHDRAASPRRSDS